MKRAPRSLQHHVLYRKYNGQDSEISALLGKCGLNSLSDIGCMMLGSTIARRLPWWASAALVVLLELVALVAIRDNLTLNLIMLIAPVEAIRQWQMG